jgi:hypothetical protein
MDIEPFKKAVQEALQSSDLESNCIGRFVQELVARHEPHDNLKVVLDKLFDCVRRMQDALTDPESANPADYYRDVAKRLWAEDELEIDDNARVACTDDGFAWVQAWVRVERDGPS